MTRPSPPSPARRERTGRALMSPARGVSATWWYTATAVMFLEFVIALVWIAALVEADHDRAVLLTVAIGGVLWWLSTWLLLRDYRHRDEGAPLSPWPRVVVPLVLATGFGVVAGLISGMWLMAAVPLAQSVVLLNWAPGVRVRLVVGVTAILGVLWYVDGRASLDGGGESWWLFGLLATFLPMMSVFSLWWWDVIVTVDRARASESRLAATQERLRVANDVHDLQGHHLQVIALQLELAERLMSRDPDTALTQLRAARESVDEARQGTRDLALGLRSVPLRDEIANAADLLRAAGATVQTTVDAGTDSAPASVLGPVIRETTTNVLRHGGGRWARLSLTRDGDRWRYEIVNDPPGAPVAHADGSGLDGIRRRIAGAGGTIDVAHGTQEFSVVVSAPATPEGPR